MVSTRLQQNEYRKTAMHHKAVAEGGNLDEAVAVVECRWERPLAGHLPRLRHAEAARSTYCDGGSIG